MISKSWSIMDTKKCLNIWLWLLFLVFPMMLGFQVVKPSTKNQFCFLSLIRCLVKFVVLESRSQTLWMHNQYLITINTHLLSHIATFCLYLYFFAQTKFVSLLLFSLLTCNNTIRSVLLKARKINWDTKHYFHKKENFHLPTQQSKSKFVDVFNASFERMNFASTER